MKLFDNVTLSYLIALFDIVIVSYLIYRGLNIIKGTRATPMLVGLGVIVILYLVARSTGLVTLMWILGNFLSYLIIIFVIIFQEEIRRGLTKFGLQSMVSRSGKKLVDKHIEDITLVCVRLADAKTGALIVIQRDVGLDEFVEDAVYLDAMLNRKLLYTIFQKDSALHDGAVLIDSERIKAAGCVLPLSFDPDVDPHLGTRHRAAIGISDRSDAIVIVVSEENGVISVVKDGKITRNLDANLLRTTLDDLLSKPKIAKKVSNVIKSGESLITDNTKEKS